MNSAEDDLPPPPPELARQPEVVAPVNDRPTVSVHTVHRAPPISTASYDKELPPPVSWMGVVSGRVWIWHMPAPASGML